MTYHANTERGPLVFLLIIDLYMIVSVIGRNFYLAFFIFQVLLIIFTFLVIFLRFELSLKEDMLTFRTFLFAMTVYQKTVESQEINQIKFKRIGWGHKCATIKVSEGFNLRVANFHPKTIYKDLNEYANHYNIAVTKTKDFKRLEK
ncbi:hypothetical protein [Ornithinibacillus xuwenensis]|uniref:Uncharacterized protein n=1 Tax=Ornithinibacillus xuwenensis TaxID=3144668 RepID=A0ABU9XHN7_9BACI